MNEPIHLNDDAFEKTVLKSSLPVLVDFWAPWCAPCRMVAPSLDKIAREFSGRVVVAKVNTDENQKWAQHYGVRGIPTMLFVEGGQVAFEQVGALSYPDIKKMVEKLLAASEQAQKVVN